MPQFSVLYAGPAPAYADSALGAGNNLLATLAMSAVPFGQPSGTSPGDAVLLAAADLTPTPAASATGEATFFRIHGSDGSPHVQGTAGKNNADCSLNSAAIQQGAGIWIDALMLIFAP